MPIEKQFKRKKHPKSLWHRPKPRKIHAFSELDKKTDFFADHIKAVCRRCGIIMPDIEPQAHAPEFFHPLDADKPCKNGGTYSRSYNVEFLPFMRKRNRRAIARGARAARKHRPR